MVQKKISSNSILFALLLILCFYCFWFQIAYFSIPGFLPVISVLLILTMLVNHHGIIDVASLRTLKGFVIFTIFIIFGIIFAQNKSVTAGYIVQHIKYTIPLIAIFSYIDGEKEKMRNIAWGIVIAVCLLCITAFINPTDTAGSITVNTLSTNTFASFLGIMESLCLYLICDDRTKPVLRKLLLGIIVVGFIMSIGVASRRGFLVYALVLIVDSFFITKYKYNNSFGKKLFIGIVLICVFAGVGLYLFIYSGDMRLFQRFAIHNYQGDILREQYQKAAYSYFLEQPILGNGLGFVSFKNGVYSHSLYYELLACTGIIGFVIYIGFFLKRAFSLIVATKKSNINNEKCQYIVMAVFTFSIFISGFAVVYIYDMYFFIMIALISSTDRIGLKYSQRILT